jgi:Ca2+-binding EF-hand superfamily protein
MVREVDRDGDGTISYSEFRAVMRKNIQKHSEEVAVLLRDSFVAFDQNGDGFIETNELKDVLTKVIAGRRSSMRSGDTMSSVKFSDEEIQLIVESADTSGDGVIDYNEFVSYMTSLSSVGAEEKIAARWKKIDELRLKSKGQSKESTIDSQKRAVDVLKLLAKFLEPSPMEFVDAFGALPSGFRESRLHRERSIRPPSTYLLPRRSEDGLSLNELAFDLASTDILPVETFVANVRVQGARGVPIPFRAMKSVRGRHINISLYLPDEDRFISNVHQIEASWNQRTEDQWSFLKSDFENDFTVRCGWGQNAVLFFELAVTVQKKKRKRPIEMSSAIGWIPLPILGTQLARIPGFHGVLHRVQLFGGAPNKPSRIEEADVMCMTLCIQHSTFNIQHSTSVFGCAADPDGRRLLTHTLFMMSVLSFNSARRKGWRKIARAMGRGQPTPELLVRIISLKNAPRRHALYAAGSTHISLPPPPPPILRSN